MTPTAPGDIKFAYCLRIIFVIETYAYIFRMGGTDFLLVRFSTGLTFHEKGSFQGVNFSGEVLHCGTLPEFLHKIRLLSCSLFNDSYFTHGDVKGNCPG